MSANGWILIRNWTKYQARRDERDWHYVRNQVGLLSDDDYLRLPVKTALVWHRLLIAYASSRGQLANDTRTLSNRLGQRVTKAQLELLNHAGFIDFSAAKPPRLGSETAAPRARDALVRELPTTQDHAQPQGQEQAPSPVQSVARPLGDGHHQEPTAGANNDQARPDDNINIDLTHYWQQRAAEQANPANHDLEPLAEQLAHQLREATP